MASFETGVSHYLTGTATVRNFFPVDHKGNMDVCCDQCRFFNMRNHRCNLNDCMCPYPTRGIAPDCPLEITEDKE